MESHKEETLRRIAAHGACLREREDAIISRVATGLMMFIVGAGLIAIFTGIVDFGPAMELPGLIRFTLVVIGGAVGLVGIWKILSGLSTAPPEPFR
jgi:hypothetical protein